MKLVKVNGNKKIIVLGAGGTGSWLCSFISKLSLKDVIVIDGDIIEEKNTLRQNFTDNEVGRNKAEMIAKRYGFLYDTDFITEVDDIVDLLGNVTGMVPVICGCLDNNASRKIVHDLFMSDIYQDMVWIDGGNAERHGQVYLAVKQNGEVLFDSPVNLDEVFANVDGDERRPDQISCAEHSESAPQNIAANITSATMMFDILNKVIEGSVFTHNKFMFDTNTVGFNSRLVEK